MVARLTRVTCGLGRWEASTRTRATRRNLFGAVPPDSRVATMPDAIEQYLEKSHEQASAMNAVPATCELVVEYKSAAKLIGKEVHSLVVGEFAPLFKDDFLDLAGEQRPVDQPGDAVVRRRRRLS